MYIFKLQLKFNEKENPSLISYTLVSEMGKNYKKMYFFKLNNHQLIDNTKLNTLTQKHAQNMNMILILTLSYM